MYLIFDTGTTGLPKRWDVPHTDVDKLNLSSNRNESKNKISKPP